jgi:hypothetical protein
MSATLVGRVLLGIGLVIGIVAGVALMVGFEPARLPRALLNLAAYKLAFIAAAGLMAAGAMFNRYSHRKSQLNESPPRSTDPLSQGTEGHALNEGRNEPRRKESDRIRGRQDGHKS